MSDYLPDIEYINKTGEELVRRSDSNEKVDSLQDQLTSINQRWDGVSQNIASKLDQLSLWVQTLQQFEVRDGGTHSLVQHSITQCVKSLQTQIHVARITRD